jgi:hypothetical protein
MRMSKRAVLIFCVLISYSTTLLAHWQFSKWDMSPKQLVIASGGKVVKIDPADLGTLFRNKSFAAGTFKDFGTSFAANFYFKTESGPMSAIRLEPTPKQNASVCDSLERVLQKQFGQPESSEFRDKPGGLLLAAKTLRWSEKPSGDRYMFSWAKFKPGKRGDGRVETSIVKCRVIIQPPA